MFGVLEGMPMFMCNIQSILNVVSPPAIATAHEAEKITLLRRQQGATNKRYITLLCSLEDANSVAVLAQWYKW